MYRRFLSRMACVVCSCTTRMFLISLNLSFNDLLISSDFILKFYVSDCTSYSFGFSDKAVSIIWYISIRHSVLRLIYSMTSYSGRTSWPLWAPKRAQLAQILSLLVTLMRSIGLPWMGHMSTMGAWGCWLIVADIWDWFIAIAFSIAGFFDATVDDR